MTGAYLARRLAQLLPTTGLIVVVGFVLVQVAPGDPVLALAGEYGDAEYYALMRERFGLDQPLHRQFVTYLSNVAQGDLGHSYTQGRPASSIILERLPATLLLTSAALLLSSVTGLLLGVVAATRRHRWSDTSISAVMLVVYAAPVFLVGQLAVLSFGLGLGWLPVHGMTSAVSPETTIGRWWDVAQHLLLPASALAAQEVAAVGRLTRSGIREQLLMDHVVTARAKGVSPAAVLLRHALRGALLPVVTVIGNRVGHLVAGAIVVEAVFGWPGMGQLLVSATQNRDHPITLGIFLLVALTVVSANLLTDLAYAWLDPRVQHH